MYILVCILGIYPDTSGVFAHKTDHLVTRLWQILKSMDSTIIKEEYDHNILISIPKQ